MAQINIVNQEIGGKIMNRRKKLNITQAQLGGAVGLTRTSVVNIEKGVQGITVYNLLKVCSILKSKPTDFLPKVPYATIKEKVKKTKVTEYKTMDADFKW